MKEKTQTRNNDGGARYKIAKTHTSRELTRMTSNSVCAMYSKLRPHLSRQPGAATEPARLGRRPCFETILPVAFKICSTSNF